MKHNQIRRLSGVCYCFCLIRQRVIVSALFLCALTFGIYAQGLTGEILSTQRWREISSHYSALSNPAFLTEEQYTSACGTFMVPILGNAGIWEGAVTYPVGLDQSIGFSWVGQSSSPIVKQDYLNPGDSSTTGFQSHFFIASYAVNFWKGLSVGINATVAFQNAFGETRSGYGLDAAASYRVMTNPLLGTHLFGIAAQNVLPPMLKATNENETFSRNVRLTWYSLFWDNNIESNIDFVVKDVFTSQQNASPLWESGFRLGISLADILHPAGMVCLTSEGLKYIGAAISLNVPMANNGRDFMFGYQCIRLTQQIEQLLAHTFFFRIEIGEHREEVFAKQCAQRLYNAPSDLYNKALALYYAEKYWDAFFLLLQIKTQYPIFYKNDWVSYFAASCEEHLDMHAAALRSFSRTKAEYPNSSACSLSDLSVMDIHYRTNDFSAVASDFNERFKGQVADSIKSVAAYIYGQAAMKQHDYAKAVVLFKAIPQNHPDYLFAQHSAAIALLAQNRPTDAAVHFQRCIADSAQSKLQKQIVDRSRLFLAFMLYENIIQEERGISKAVSLVKSISKESLCYKDAQMLWGWLALKSNRLADCIAAGTALRLSSGLLHYSEGSLLCGYGLMKQGDDRKAKDILLDANTRIERATALPADSIDIIKQHIAIVSIANDSIAMSMERYGSQQSLSYVQERIDLLHTRQRSLAQEIKTDRDFLDEQQNVSFLTRNLSKLKSDISYLLAVVSKRVLEEPIRKEQIKNSEKQKEIDTKINQLKDQLQKK